MKSSLRKSRNHQQEAGRGVRNGQGLFVSLTVNQRISSSKRRQMAVDRTLFVSHALYEHTAVGVKPAKFCKSALLVGDWRLCSLVTPSALWLQRRNLNLLRKSLLGPGCCGDVTSF